MTWGGVKVLLQKILYSLVFLIGLVWPFGTLLYHSTEGIHSEKKSSLFINWSGTVEQILRPKLVLLLTEILQNAPVFKKHDVFYTSTIPEVTWYEPLYINHLMPNPFLYIQTFLFQTSQVSINALFRSIQPVDRNLSGVTTPGQYGPGGDGNKGVLCIPQCSRITKASPSDFLVLYIGHALGVGWGLIPRQRYSLCIPQHPQTTRPVKVCFLSGSALRF